MSYIGHIIDDTKMNSFFRKVVFTGAKSQLVVMDIKPGESIGKETHEHVEQILFFLTGFGTAIFNGKEEPINAGDVAVVTPGTEHDFINTGAESMKVYTIYCPPNHIEGRIHKTKAEAEADTEDEEFGHAIQ